MIAPATRPTTVAKNTPPLVQVSAPAPATADATLNSPGSMRLQMK